MPTVLRVGPYRFFFYSSDWQEPPHVHVQGGEATGEFWLAPVRLAGSKGFGEAELNRIQRPVRDNEQQLRRSWDDYFHS